MIDLLAFLRDVFYDKLLRNTNLAFLKSVNVKIRMHNFDCIVMYKNDFMDNYVIKWWIVIT